MQESRRVQDRWDSGHGMQHKWDAKQDGGRKGRKQNKKEAGKEGCNKGVMHESRGARTEG